MNVLTLDIESYYAPRHDIKSLGLIQYIQHPNTEIISLAYAYNGDPVKMLWGEPAIQEWVDAQDWENITLLAHNTQFDGSILAWRFGAIPKRYLCSLSMGKPITGKTVGGSLKAMSEYFKVGKKLDLEATNMKGKHLKDLSQAERIALETYNIRDVELCRRLARILIRQTADSELKLIDQTVRMMTQPVLEVDTDLLKNALVEEKTRKREALERLGRELGSHDVAEVKSMLMSNIKFSELLERHGVPLPTKISASTGKETYAFAKTDEAFLDLQNHQDPAVALAAQTRLGTKSTIVETRIETFIEVAECCNGKMPIVLNYFGALNSGRFSGAGASMNQQNLSRVDPSNPKPSDVLRQSIRAPIGHKIVVSDLSGIEMRVLHYLANVPSTMEAYAADPQADLYKIFAARMYRCEVKEVTKPQRQLAKAALLGLQFGAAAPTFHRVAKLQGVDMSLEEIANVVVEWREFYSSIVNFWGDCGKAIKAMARGSVGRVDTRGIITTDKEKLILPDGVELRYPELRQEEDKDTGKSNWVYGHGRLKQKIYSSKLAENITQAVARLFLTNALLKIDGRHLCRMHVHDEVMVVTPAHEAAEALEFMNSVMREPPPWFPDIVLWSEGDIADSYGAAK